MTIPHNTPILVGAGQTVERGATLESPLQLASRAAAIAVADCGGENVAGAIDTIAVVKLFSDSAPMWSCPFGRSDNPPQSIARAIGAEPAARIYTETGGNQPQSLVIEMARAIARGEKSMVLLAGAEAIRNQRKAESSGQAPDWTEHFEVELEDRGFGEMVATIQERKNGMIAPIFYYILIEQARRERLGLDVESYRRETAAMMAQFSSVAASNPYAQFAGELSAGEILDADPLTHLYTKRMIAQDGVNQSAAIILCNVGTALELGIPEDNWVFIHGMAEGKEVDLSERAEPDRSAMACMVVDRALEQAELDIEDVDLIDIYSCFPCAITAITDHLDLPVDGSRGLTLTGGLPYFGGPGNNYSMHALAEVVGRLRSRPEQFALVTTNGGVLSKHASGIYSRKPSEVDWISEETYVGNLGIERRDIASNPGKGRVLSYTVNWLGADPVQVIALAETGRGERFVCCTAPDDPATVLSALDRDPTGRRIVVTPPEDHTLHFQFADTL